MCQTRPWLASFCSRSESWGNESSYSPGTKVVYPYQSPSPAPTFTLRLVNRLCGKGFGRVWGTFSVAANCTSDPFLSWMPDLAGALPFPTPVGISQQTPQQPTSPQSRQVPPCGISALSPTSLPFCKFETAVFRLFMGDTAQHCFTSLW